MCCVWISCLEAFKIWIFNCFILFNLLVFVCLQKHLIFILCRFGFLRKLFSILLHIRGYQFLAFNPSKVSDLVSNFYKFLFSWFHTCYKMPFILADNSDLFHLFSNGSKLCGSRDAFVLVINNSELCSLHIMKFVVFWFWFRFVMMPFKVHGCWFRLVDNAFYFVALHIRNMIRAICINLCTLMLKDTINIPSYQIVAFFIFYTLENHI